MRWLATMGLVLLAAPASADGTPGDGPWVEGGAHPEGDDTCHAYHVLGERVLAFCHRRVLGIGMDEQYELGPGSLQGPWAEADIQTEGDAQCHAYEALGNRLLGFCVRPFVDLHGHYEAGPDSLDGPWVEVAAAPDGDGTCHTVDALGNRAFRACGVDPLGLDGHYALGPASLEEEPLAHGSRQDGDATCHAFDAFGNRVLAFCLRDDVA